MDVQQEMRNLQELHESGAITDTEFEQRKAQLHNYPSVGAVPPPPQPAYAGADQETRQWAMILHLSQFAGYIVFVIGLVAPVIIWQMKKNDLPGIDAHGKIVVNWLLSAIIYSVISFILMFVLIGIPMLIALGVMAIIFPIIGGIKANNGELWPYPLSIKFFK